MMYEQAYHPFSSLLPPTIAYRLETIASAASRLEAIAASIPSLHRWFWGARKSDHSCPGDHVTWEILLLPEGACRIECRTDRIGVSGSCPYSDGFALSGVP